MPCIRFKPYMQYITLYHILLHKNHIITIFPIFLFLPQKKRLLQKTDYSSTFAIVLYFLEQKIICYAFRNGIILL